MNSDKYVNLIEVGCTDQNWFAFISAWPLLIFKLGHNFHFFFIQFENFSPRDLGICKDDFNYTLTL